ncbi:hypothetical protein J6590_048788 [Homalodisca vitripennis]|nr:hypothetical protein J6590_048788 [Homalodisca vitripennis]
MDPGITDRGPLSITRLAATSWCRREGTAPGALFDSPPRTPNRSLLLFPFSRPRLVAAVRHRFHSRNGRGHRLHDAVRRHDLRSVCEEVTINYQRRLSRSQGQSGDLAASSAVTDHNAPGVRLIHTKQLVWSVGLSHRALRETRESFRSDTVKFRMFLLPQLDYQRKGNNFNYTLMRQTSCCFMVAGNCKVTQYRTKEKVLCIDRYLYSEAKHISGKGMKK